MRGQPIVRQIMALVMLATLLASAAMIAITFAGPPPMRAPAPVGRLAAILVGDAPPMMGLERRKSSRPPAIPPGLSRNARLESDLSGMIGCAACTVAAYSREHVLPHADAVPGDFLIALRTQDGSWTVVDSGPDPERSRWQRTTAATIALVLLAILTLAFLVARRIVRPIEDLGTAASLASPGEEWRFAIPEGPPEVRAAALALRDQHDANLAHAQEQLTMLAAISHDVGTPLARLAFRIESLPQTARDAAMADIVAIRRLLGDSLTLARGWSGPFASVSLRQLCEHIVAREQEQGHPVTSGALQDLVVDGDALSLERMVQNIVDNALRYGKTARLTLESAGGSVSLIVTDEGPGFAGLPREDLLKPFVRADQSRNAASGGSGLGLAIAAQIAARHGGSIALETAQKGGGIVRVTLPARSPSL